MYLVFCLAMNGFSGRFIVVVVGGIVFVLVARECDERCGSFGLPPDRQMICRRKLVIVTQKGGVRERHCVDSYVMYHFEHGC